MFAASQVVAEVENQKFLAYHAYHGHHFVPSKTFKKVFMLNENFNPRTRSSE